MVLLIAFFHYGMLARVQEDKDASQLFPVKNLVKQGCILAPTLFSTLLPTMPLDAYRECERGVYIHFCCDGKLLNL